MNEFSFFGNCYRDLKFLLLVLLPLIAHAEDLTLKLSPGTVAWGYYAANTQPVLRIRSGDTIEIETCSGRPELLMSLGVPRDRICPALLDIYAGVSNKGPGGHILTGPVFVEGAEPGDVLEVQIQKIRPGALRSELISARGRLPPERFSLRS